MSVAGRAVLALSAALTALPAFAQRPPSAASVPERTFGTPKSYANLTIVPVYETRATSSARIITLDEALRAGVVKVREAGRSGEVNKVVIDNLGDRPIFILGGEVVLGGQQDRCIGQDTLVPPKKMGMGVTVFCVEHGRWSGKGEFDAAGQSLAQKEVRLYAQDGGFAASRPAAAAPRTGRAVSQPAASDVGAAQGRVWQAVARKNRRFGAETSTGTYRQVVQSSAGQLATAVRTTEKALLGALGRDPRLVGVVVAVNNKVVAADVFSDAALFRKVWPKLLRGYATDAAEAVTESRSGRAPVTARDAEAFLRNAVAQARVERATSGEMLRERLENETTVVHRAAGALGGAPGAAAPPLRHENILRK